MPEDDREQETQPDLLLPDVLPPAVAAGSTAVATDLKRRLGIDVTQRDDEVDEVGLDGFKLWRQSPYVTEHGIITQALENFARSRLQPYGTIATDNNGDEHFVPFVTDDEVADLQFEATKVLAEAPSKRKLRAALRERRASLSKERMSRFDCGDPEWEVPSVLDDMIRRMDERGIPATRDSEAGGRDGFFDRMLTESSNLDDYGKGRLPLPEVEQAERFHAESPLTDGERHVLHRMRCRVLSQPPLGELDESLSRLNVLIDGKKTTLLLVPGEHWSDAVHHDLAKTTPPRRRAWATLLRHAASASSGSSSKKWQKAAAAAMQPVGGSLVRKQFAAWFSLVARGRSLAMMPNQYEHLTQDTLNEHNATVLKGLVWTLAGQADAASPRVVADLLLTSLKKIPGVGPRCVKVANACVWTLGEMAADKDAAVRDAALGQLARLKARVTFRTTLNAIERALEKAAAKAGVPKEDLEELGTPAFDFVGGDRVEQLGDATATLRVVGNKVTTTWTNDKGKAVKAVPAGVKREHKDELKELKQAAKDAEGVLLAGRDRLDSLYLADKSWKLADWRDRYLNHGLLGTLTRRLIWRVDGTPVLFDGETAKDLTGESLTFGDTAEVRLWHPIDTPMDEVLAWRDRLASIEITQPFKQAHREVYLLTDAERNTNTYSNRFAAHILRQHQFNALCAAKRWRNQLRLLVDDVYEPPHRLLPAYDLRAEFWVVGAGDETNDTGVYTYLATDQVRFYRTAATRNLQHAGGGGYDMSGRDGDEGNAPLPLDQIPPLVLSEVLRDCDLFVGVTSVGNDLDWQDGGRQPAFGDYWQSFAFGDLSQTAMTRKAVLEKLVPRLKIADRCTFVDKFLVVRGDLQSYKIHLGSGNILMTPNDAYLCIVPGRSPPTTPKQAFLPFEGDRTLSIILSKAMLLADESKITDPTILSQIR